MGIKTILECDKCGTTLELDGPYHIAKAGMKEAGWKNVKVDEEWKIKCPECNGGKK